MQQDHTKPPPHDRKATSIITHLCLGLILAAVVIIAQRTIFPEVTYIGSDGKDLWMRRSIEEGSAPQIRYHNKVYLTPSGEEALLTQTGAFLPLDSYHSYAKLPDCKVFVTGKNEDYNDMTDDTTIFDPKTGTRTDGPKMLVKCIAPTLTSLRNGQVLMTGGFRDGKLGPIDKICIYDPKTNSIAQIGRLLTPRARLTCFQINDNEVLAIGGSIQPQKWVGTGDTTGDIEIIDLKSGKTRLFQQIIKCAEPIVIRDDKKDIYVIGGSFSDLAGDYCWRTNITRLNIPRDQVN